MLMRPQVISEGWLCSFQRDGYALRFNGLSYVISVKDAFNFLRKMSKKGLVLVATVASFNALINSLGKTSELEE
ncbi:hypothetical protein TB1_022473 [Malus domestica]